MEYLLVHLGGRGQTLVYQLQYQGEQADRFMMGLISLDDENDTNQGYDEKKSGVNTARSGSSRPQVGAISEASRTSEISLQPNRNQDFINPSSLVAQNALLEKKNNNNRNANSHSLNGVESMAGH